MTVAQLPGKVPQVPSASAIESRSTRPDVESTPEPPSVPLPSVSGTDAVVYQGPPESAAVGPLGAVTSFVTVNEPVVVSPAPFATVTVCAPEALVEAPQA